MKHTKLNTIISFFTNEIQDDGKFIKAHTFEYKNNNNNIYKYLALSLGKAIFNDSIYKLNRFDINPYISIRTKGLVEDQVNLINERLESFSNYYNYNNKYQISLINEELKFNQSDYSSLRIEEPYFIKSIPFRLSLLKDTRFDDTSYLAQRIYIIENTDYCLFLKYLKMAELNNHIKYEDFDTLTLSFINHYHKYFTTEYRSYIFYHPNNLNNSEYDDEFNPR